MVPKALPFQLRLYQNDLITSHSGKSCGKGERFFACSQAGKQRILTGKRWVWGRRVSIVALGHRMENCSLWQPTIVQTALADHRWRWGIETLFTALKTRGFSLKSSHFSHAERLSKLVMLLALAFC